MSALASDNFNRANNTSISGNWSNGTSGTNFINITSNALAPTGNADDGWAFYNAFSWPNDHYSQVQVSGTGSTGGGSGFGVQCRQASPASTITCYRTTIDQTLWQIAKQVGGAFTSFQTGTPTFVAGATIRMEVTGSSPGIIKVFYNGSQLGTNQSDSAISSGSAGVYYSSTDASLTADNWEGGDFSTFVPAQFDQSYVPFKYKLVGY